MKFTIYQKKLIEKLKIINSIITKNQKNKILENILITIKKKTLFLISTDLEKEIIVKTSKIKNIIEGKITISGQKILNLCRNINENVKIIFILIKNKMKIIANKSKFLILTLPASNFPRIYINNTKKKNFFLISEKKLKYMIFKTKFSMGIKDVRYYLNGILLEIKKNKLFIVATDGYRMALCSIKINIKYNNYKIIIPRKSILEIYKLLKENNKNLIKIKIFKNNIIINIRNIIFISKLIEGLFPNYYNVLLKNIKYKISFNKNLLKKTLLRTSIFCYENFHGVCMKINKNICKITTNNQEEKILEKIKILNLTKKIEITANIFYILDVINVIYKKNISFFLKKTNSKIQILEKNKFLSVYVIMPINL
ncbi:DNA polymerase III subunit beta [Buchnera aphidicola]|uniref:DNA polymerase III subunit beta n=1 Tax=Buchnera aphidicola TaxID=9 RepID=UPI0031B80839